MQGRVGSDESQGLKHRQIYPDFGLREEARSNAHLDFTHRQSQKPGVTQVPASVVISLPFSLKQEQQAVCSHAAGGGREETHRAEAESKA